MAIGSTYAAIRAFFEANWANACPVVFDNEGALPPADGHWIMFDVVGDSIVQQTIGTGRSENERHDEDGKLLLYVMAPQGVGTARARELAEMLVNLFRGVLLLNDSIEFQDASVGYGAGRNDEGNWFRFPIEIYWRRMGV